MKTIKLYLNDVSRVKDFVRLSSRIDSDINVSHMHYTVDGKSLLGLFSIDLSVPVDVTIISDDDAEIDKFVMNCKEWIVE